jgi:hypothetical protein
MIENEFGEKTTIGKMPTNFMLTNYMWKNMIVEKRDRTNWLYRLYKDSPLHDIWLVLTSPVN